VGLLTKHTPEMTHASTRDLTWQSPASALARVRQEAEPAGALVIPMTHLGVQGDRALARAHPDLALIVGGHSHTRLEEGVIEGQTLIVQTGAKATTLGRVDLWLDPDSHEVLRSRSRLIKLLAEPDDSDRNLKLEVACKKLVLASERRMGVVVGSLSAPLMRGLDRYSSSASGNLVTDVMRDHTGATVALHNRGGLRADLPAGEVTRRDLFRVLPFENHVVSMDMTGAQLAKLLRRSVEGQGHSGLEVSGVTLYLLPGDEGPKLGKVVVGGEDLVAAETYRVVTNSFLAAGGDDYGTFAEGTGRQVDPILLRDLLETAFGSEPLTPPKASRFVLSE
jgi:2',3'-cyclic-nucleotide 2'-phosphodiesterase (5'-nucleotidase family)